MKRPLVSVIIPIYNVCDYIQRCIDSVLGQTLIDIEIIIIDDGSSDGGDEICDRYAIMDNRVRVIHKVHEGLSEARNDGLLVASAPYIMFVDGDDWVEPDFCYLPYCEAINNNADIVLFTYNIIKNDTISSKIQSQIHSGLITEKEALFFNTYVSHNIWTAIYRKDLFNNVRFPLGKLYEDIGTSHRLIRNANNICMINKTLYNYRTDRQDSITRALSTRLHKNRIEMLITKTNDLYIWGYRDFAYYYCFLIMARYGTQYVTQFPMIEIAEKMVKDLPADFNLKKKIMLLIYKISPPLFDWICYALNKRIK